MTTPQPPDPYGQPPQPGPYGVPDRPSPSEGPAGPALPPQPGPYGVPAYGTPPLQDAASPGAYASAPTGAPAYPPHYVLADVGRPSAGRAASEAFRLFGRAAGPLVGFVACSAVISIAVSLVVAMVFVVTGLPAAGPFDPAGPPLLNPVATGGMMLGTALSSALTAFVSAVLGLMLMRGALQLARTGRLAFTDFWSLPGTWWVYGLVTAGLGVLASFPTGNGALAVIGLVLGLAALVVHVCFVYAAPALLDRPEPPLRAFATSLRLVGDNLGQTLLFVLIAIGLTILGVLACFVGLLVSTPILVVALARLYCAIRGERVVVA